MTKVTGKGRGGPRPNSGGARPGAGRPRKQPQGLVIDVQAVRKLDPTPTKPVEKPSAAKAKPVPKPKPPPKAEHEPEHDLTDDEFADLIRPPEMKMGARPTPPPEGHEKIEGMDKTFWKRVAEIADMAAVPLPVTDDPKVFLTAVMNHPSADGKMRIEAAKTLMPFTHSKLAEQGKKVERANAAKEAGAGRFASAQPPKLVVNNK